MHNRLGEVSRRRVLEAGALSAAALTASSLSCARAPSAVPEANSKPNPVEPARYRFRLDEREIDLTGKRVRAQLVNGKLPGPEIRVKEGDLLRVTVENGLPIPATIHWHGLIVPNPMDGVPEVTQAPIAPNQVYVYEYPIVQSGTYWYHSHFQAQEQAGLHGPLVIEPRTEPHSYDHDFVLFLSDYLEISPWDVVPRIRRGELRVPDSTRSLHSLPSGQKFDVDLVYPAFPLNGKTERDPWTCRVKPGDRVRFRLINGSAQSFFRFMLDGHQLEVIAADGQSVRPVIVDNLILATAERYDVLVRVSKSGSFTIRGAALGQDSGAVGVMHTSDVRPSISGARPVWGPRVLDYAQLWSPESTTLPDGPIKTFRLACGGNMMKYLWSINDQYYPEPAYVPAGKADALLIREGDRVRVEIVNPTPMFHPFHLHGHFYRLLARNGEDSHAPLKDTVIVPPRGSTRLEFLADNPGRWLFHCHFLYHLLAGMARVWEYVL
jgi:multicopper oxidase